MKKTKKKIAKRPFIVREPNHLTGLKFKKEAKVLRLIVLNVSRSSRRASLNDRIKLRKMLDSMTRYAGILEGKSV